MQFSGKGIWVAEFEDDGFVVFDPAKQNRKDPARAILWSHRDTTFDAYYKDMVGAFLNEVVDSEKRYQVLAAYFNFRRREQRGYDQKWKPRADRRTSASEELDQEIVNALASANAFHLIIFDLDGTLLKTEDLQTFRGREHLSNTSFAYKESLLTASLDVVELIPNDFLAAIADCCPQLKMAVVTRSPRAYAKTLLESFYPTIKWHAIVAFEDVHAPKPDPEGYQVAAARADVSDPARVVVVGDSDEDIDAAYRAGFSVALFRGDWGREWNYPGQPNRTNRYRAIEKVPDAVLDSADELTDLLINPSHLLPTAESYLGRSATQGSPVSIRGDAINHFNNLADEKRADNKISVTVLGRYFKANSPYETRRRSHALTNVVLAAKETVVYPDEIERCLAKAIDSTAKGAAFMDQPVLVCPIPARPGRPQRMERLLAGVSGHLECRGELMMALDALTFSADVKSNKALDQCNRYENIRDHLKVTSPSAIKGKAVIVVDDVVASGATFYYAKKYLFQAGAADVQCIALAQSV